MVTPCRDCADRYESCHSECDKYKSWRAELDAEREVVAKVKYNEGSLIKRRNDAIRKMRKSKKLRHN